MKTVLLLTFLVFGPGAAHSQESCGASSKSTVQDLKSLCQELDKKNEAHCQVKVPAKTEKMPEITYGLLGASSKMKGLFEKLNGLQQAFLKDPGGCPGGCSKVNSPVVEIKTEPTATVADASCPASYTVLQVSAGEASKYGVKQLEKSFQKAFRLVGDEKACQEKASTFAQETLMGKNEFGSFLEDRKCQSPCSYASVIRMKTEKLGKAECAVVLELSVQCGPPKKDREWKTNASLTKAFRCEVAP
ncbi:hypothetical protein [Bdellovibrio bacteriovorus]|uniref:hypothetical protein n=1 Tax=Bdellovibrio bacteriovorus TaxID=959 RepID=UPI0035A5ABDA